MAKQADAPDLGSGEHSVLEGPNPSTDTGYYVSDKGRFVKATVGYWNGGVSNQPFVEGYWVETFIPKVEFDKEYRRL